MNPQKGIAAIKIIAAIILTTIGILGSLKLKSSNIISERSLDLFCIGSVLVGLFIVYSDKIKVIDFYKGQLILSEMRKTEASIKEVARAILDVIDKSNHCLALPSFDQKALDNSIEKLKALIA